MPGTVLLPVTGKKDGKRGQVIACVLVLDDEFTAGVLRPLRWNLLAGYARHAPWGGAGIFLHALVYGHYHGTLPAGHEIDHADRNPLNCVPSNLRAVTRSVNNANRGGMRNNTSGYRGVTWQKREGCWQAGVQVLGKFKNLGLFADKQEAARAVNAAYACFFPGVPLPNPDVA